MKRLNTNVLHTLSVCLLLAFATMVLPEPAHAQSKEIEQIDKIMLDESYLFTEATDANKNIAYDNALFELMISVNELRQDEGKDKLSINDLTTKVDRIEYQRGDATVVFLYIKRSKAISISKVVISNTTPTIPEGQANFVDLMSGKLHFKPNGGNAAGDNKQEVAAAAVDTVATAPVVAEAVVEDSVAADTTVADTIAVEEPLLAADDDVVVGNSDVMATIIPYLLELDMVNEAYRYLKGKYDAEQLSGLQFTVKRAEVPADVYAIIFNVERSIVALLSPADSKGVRTNIRTGADDAIEKYNKCAVLWFK